MTRKQITGLATMAMVFLAVPAAASESQELNQLITRGQAIAEEKCARCHAVGRTGASKLAIAPPLRDLNKQYPVRQLEEAFAEGIVTRHKDMPEFRFDPPDIGALLTYMENLSKPGK